MGSGTFTLKIVLAVRALYLKIMAYARWKRRHRVDRFVTRTRLRTRLTACTLHEILRVARDLHVKLIVRMEHGIYREIKVKFALKKIMEMIFALNNGVILDNIPLSLQIFYIFFIFIHTLFHVFGIIRNTFVIFIDFQKYPLLNPLWNSWIFFFIILLIRNRNFRNRSLIL